MPRPVLRRGRVERHHPVRRIRAGGIERRGDRQAGLAPSFPSRVRELRPDHRAQDGEPDDRPGEEARGTHRGPCGTASGDPVDDERDAFEGQDVGERRESDRGVDERAARDVDRGHEGREGEQCRCIDEERSEVLGSTSSPSADDHQRRKQDPTDERDVDHDRGDEPADPGREERSDPHIQEMPERGRDRDAVPLVDRSDEQDLAQAVDGDSDPKTASWRAHHGAMTSTNTATHPTAAANGIDGVPRRPSARHASGPRRTAARASPAPARHPSARASPGRPGDQLR